MDPIKHVVVLMLENHSFDQMLGFMGLTNPDVNGVDPSRFNINPVDNSKVYQVPITTLSQQNDPGHEFEDAIEQAKDDNGHFVSNYLKNYPNATKDQIQEVMGYYPEGTLPVLHELAKNFMVCDNWFASLPGLTWPNRIFAHTGTSLGHIDMPDSLANLELHTYDQTTIFDLLSEAKISWRIYCNGPAQTLVLEHQRSHIFHYVTMDAFEGDCARRESSFPSYVFIEPTYGGVYQNDQHPPSNLLNGDALLGQVYNAIRKNKKLWESTLLVVLYDECGGFYDHVKSPETIAPDSHTEHFDFKTLGFRVPALLISPAIGTGVDHTLYDHTSLLNYLCEKWDLDPYMLGRRTPHANTFEHLVTNMIKKSPASVSAPEAVENKEYSTQETEVLKEYIVTNAEPGQNTTHLLNLIQENKP
jgi:phospholipase C